MRCSSRIKIGLILGMTVILSACGNSNQESTMAIPQAQEETTLEVQAPEDGSEQDNIEDLFQKEYTCFKYLTEEEFLEIFEEVSDSYWSLNEDEITTETAPIQEKYKEYRIYTLYSPDKELRCDFGNALSLYGGATLNVNFYWNSTDETDQDAYNAFKEDGLPEIWSIIEKLSEEEAVIDVLNELWHSKYQKQVAFYPKDQLAYYSNWGMQHSGIYVTTMMTGTPNVNQPILGSLEFENEREYNYVSKINPTDIITVQELIAIEPDIENLRKAHIIQGTLSEVITDADVDLTDIRKPVIRLPDNLYDYQEAILTDETGSVKVIVAPTALSERELGHERLHSIIIMRNRYTDEKVYLINRSCLYELGGE